MIIIGLDPGSRKAGYGVIDWQARSARYIASGVMRFDSGTELIGRMGDVYQSTFELFQTFRPDAVALESLIHVKNVNSLAKLAQARGAMIAALGKNAGAKLFEYSPNIIKSTVTGHGHADKMAVLSMLKKIIQMGPGEVLSPKTDDESDALAIAVCHGLHLTGHGASRSRGRSLKAAFSHLEGGR